MPQNEQEIPCPGPAPRPGLGLPAALAGLALSALCLGQAGHWLGRSMAELRHETLLLAQEAAMHQAETARIGTLFTIDDDERRRLRLTATAYCPGCLPGDDGLSLSASGEPVRAGRTVAVSRDLRRLLGRRVFIEGVGVRVVEDLMHPRFAARLDLCLPDKDQALAFGVQNLVVVVLD